MGYTSIVVGTDGSETAGRAVVQAAEMAAADGARLVIVTAYTPGRSRTGDVAPDEVPDDLRHVLTDRVQAEALTQSSRQAAAEAGATRITVQAVEGDPSEVLLEIAEEFAADLIVVGSKGLTSHAHFILGSVAASVAHHAPCDVLIAHTTQ